MQQTAQCPRGPFCAFAHIEHPAISASYLFPPLSPEDGINSMDGSKGSVSMISEKELVHQGSYSMSDSSLHNSPLPSPASLPNNRPIRSSSLSGPYAKIVEGTITSLANASLSSSAPAYEKAPGSGRRTSSRDGEHAQAFFGANNSLSQSSHGSEPRTPSKAMSVAAPTFYPGTSAAEEAAMDNALLDAITNIDNTFDFDFPDNTSIDSSIGGGRPGSSGPMGIGVGGTAGSSILNSSSFYGQFSNNGSDPVSIPGSQTDMRHSSFTSQQSHSPTSPIIAPGANSSFYMNQSSGGSRAGFMRSPKSTPLGLYEMIQSPKFNSPSLTSPLALGSLGNNHDLHRLSDENLMLRSKLTSWEESWNQAKQACEAWKREVAEHNDKAKASDRERMQALIKLGEIEAANRSLKQELENSMGGGPHVHLLKKVSDLENLPILELKQIFMQLKMDVDKVEKVISKRESMKCTICEETPRCVVTYPCTHCVMCNNCATTQNECPFCHQIITQKTTIFIPV